MFRAVASAAMPTDITPILGPDIELVAPQEGSFPRARLLELAASADALITLLTVAVDRELISAANKCRVIANFAVGTDNVDLELASERRIAVTNTPDVLTDASADFAFALLLGAARRLRECDELARSGRWKGWQPDQLLGASVSGKALGIIGMGRIGRAMAARARGFSMEVAYYSRSRDAEQEKLGAVFKSAHELASSSDFVTLHCPLTDATEHLVNTEFLRLMKPTATLINTSRGGCVDEQALATALRNGQLASAGLDVFEDEPHIPAALRELPNVLLAPHAGSATHFARGQMAAICARAVRAVADGHRPETLVNAGTFDAENAEDWSS